MTQDETQALGYAIAILRDRLDVEASHNAAIIRGYINTLAALRSRPAPPDDPQLGGHQCINVALDAANFCALRGDPLHAVGIRILVERYQKLAAPVAAPDDLVALRLVLKCAERACDADNLDAATDYVREALRHIDKPAPVAAQDCSTCNGSGKIDTGDFNLWRWCPECYPQHAAPVAAPAPEPGQCGLCGERDGQHGQWCQMRKPAPETHAKCNGQGIECLGCAACETPAPDAMPEKGWAAEMRAETAAWAGSCEGCPYPDTCSWFRRCTFRRRQEAQP